MRLHTRIQAFLAATALLPLAIYGVVAAHSATRSAEQATTDSVATAADQIAARVAEFVRGRTDVLQALATAIAAEPERQPLQTRRLLSQALFADETLRHLARFDPEGSLAEHTLLPAAGLPAHMAEAAARTRASGEPHVTPIAVGADLLPVVAVAVPIASLGRTDGVLVAEVETLELWSLVRRLRLAHSGYTYLLDGAGRLIAHGDPTLLAKVVEGSATLPAATPTEDGRPHASRYARHDGIEVVGATSPVPGTDWLVAVEKPAADAFSHARRLGFILALSLCATLALVSLLGWYGARIFVRRIEHLAGAARQIGSGRFEVRVEDVRADEIGDLGRGFNAMAVDLERLSGEIRRHERMSFFGRIAGGLAHDLKRPFQHLITQVRTLLDLPDDPRARTLVERTLDREQAYVDRLFDDLARFSVDGALDRQPTALVDLFARIKETMAPMAHAAGAELHLSVDGGPFDPMHVDALAIERAIRNLLENAVDAVRDVDDGRVELRLAHEPAGIRIEVLDSGPGIPDALMPHLFDAFRTTKRSGSGLGLGLAVVRRIAEEHGGTVSARNRAEGGARFVMILPNDPGPAAGASPISDSLAS
jgi:signal transduction histidine kinase